jgi:hypothetical protein
MDFKLGKEFEGYTVSEGTLLVEDLITEFLDFLEINAEHEWKRLLEEWRDTLPHTGKYNVFVSPKFKEWILNDLQEHATSLGDEVWNTLERIAPEGCYFGALEGDGACFGFWRNNDKHSKV